MITRSFILAIWLLTLLYTAVSQTMPAKPARERDGLKGVVRKVERYREPIRPNQSADQGDVNSKPSEWTVYDKDGRQLEYGPLCGVVNPFPGHSASRFDPARNLLIETSYNYKNKVTSRNFWQYDAKGREIAFYVTDARGRLIYKWVTDYDESNHSVQQTVYRNKKIRQRISREYNERGEVSVYSSYMGDGSLITREAYTYEYDEQGNWVRRVISPWVPNKGAGEFKPKEIDRRKIEYYVSN